MYFSSELLAEMWARVERARGNLAELKPDASWHDVYNICVGMASLIPVPGAAAAFMASCEIGQIILAAIESYQLFKETPAGEMLLQLKDTVMGLKEWKAGIDAARGGGRAGTVDDSTEVFPVSSGTPASTLLSLWYDNRFVHTLWPFPACGGLC